MKQLTQHKPPVSTPRSNHRSTVKARALDAQRLATVRGGRLGITVHYDETTPPIMTQQHNETLVRERP